MPYNFRELKADDIKLYDITPNQFVWLIENAKYVVTDSFHASVFSIKMSTPFVSLKRTSDNDKKNMNSRLYTLLQTVGLEDRMVGENMVNDIENIIGRDIDFESANEKLTVYMERDISKLEKHFLMSKSIKDNCSCSGCGVCKTVCPKMPSHS